MRRHLSRVAAQKERKMLKTAGLCFAYPPHFHLDGVNLRVREGDRILLRGKNGAGKSTLLRLLGGALSPFEGSVTRSSGTTAAFTGHSPSVYPCLSVRENLEFWNRLENCFHKHKNNTADPGLAEAADMLGLTGSLDEKASSLSRGMLQRLDLSRVLHSKAGLLLLDEPENSIERKYLEAFCREIIKRRHSAVVWASNVLEPDFNPAGFPLFTHLIEIKEKAIGLFTGEVKPLRGDEAC